MSLSKKYWKNLTELDTDKTISISEEIEQDHKKSIHDFLKNEETVSKETSRRDFLKYLGFTTSAAILASCEGPVHKSIPYVTQPKQIIPGKANYYATSYFDGFDFCNVLVKTREGRPIKLNANKLAKNFSFPNVRVQSSLLSLYDSNRIKNPYIRNTQVSWGDFINNLKKSIKQNEENNKKTVLITPTFPSPSFNKIVSSLENELSNFSHIVFDPFNESNALEAFNNKYGINALAGYDLSKAEVIVSFNADFLGEWQNGNNSCKFFKTRDPEKNMSYHAQFESGMSITGASADKRIPISIEKQKELLLLFSSYILGGDYDASHIEEELKNEVVQLVKLFKKHGKKAVLITGLDDLNSQKLVLEINNNINSVAYTPEKYLNIRKGVINEFNSFITELQNDKIGGIIVSGLDLVYNMPEKQKNIFINCINSKETFLATLSQRENETTKLSQYVGGLSNSLESWGDLELINGEFSLIQPTIKKLFNTLQLEELLLSLSKKIFNVDYHEFVKTYWKNTILVNSSISWGKALHDGIFIKDPSFTLTNKNISFSIFKELKQEKNNLINKDFYELELYTKTSMGIGYQINNPWCQEFPDPITRITWDNYILVSQKDANKLGLKNYSVANGGLNGSIINITTIEGVDLKNIPVIVQPGQAEGTMRLSLGYGQTENLKKEMQIGVNAYKIYDNFNSVTHIKISKTNIDHEFASLQPHSTLMGRGDIIKETTLNNFKEKDKSFWNPKPEVSLNHQMVPAISKKVDLWNEFSYSGHVFNLSIDLTKCTGCGACVISCQVENNIPVVGKDEVRKSRDMHWMRIDRYYSSENSFEEDNKKIDDISGLSESLSTFNKVEIPSSNPEVVFQPVMCQHCNHAPCETVCPVGATSHSRQGQNQMAYNRCIGTRYCANNCPYKVRRFNWFLYEGNDQFGYHMNDDLGRMVINPDVVVRSRGVMEKCSLCIQMTQKTILDAKIEGKPLSGNDFETACSSSCETSAITFGDISDKKSKISKLLNDDRAYYLLEHVGTKPNVFYHVKVRNKKTTV